MSALFIGRQAELTMLQETWRGEGGAFVPIYGRRRVGKSELILKFLEGKRFLYMVGKQAPAELQVREFLQAASACLNEPLLAHYPATDWHSALRVVEEHWSGSGRFVLALDEFQWMAGASPELPSVLQEFWDRRWQHSNQVMLILCGSYVGFMEREVLGKKSPLFGRRTGQILLRPFDFREAALFHPRYSRLDQARTYFVCGGLPYYLRCFLDTRSVEQNLAACFFNEMGPLFHEVDFLLREELREVANYYAILLALAAGHATNKSIAQQTGIGERALHYYLSTLMELGYVRRRYPLTGASPAARQVRYALEDSMLRFWFRFIFPNTSLMPRLGPERSVRELVGPGLEAFFGVAFERLCREALPIIYARQGIYAPFEVGEYWDRDVQIDIVGLRRDGWTDLGECKWGAGCTVTGLRSDLLAKKAKYPNRRGATIGLRFFTRPPLRVSSHSSDQNEQWHSLDDLYAL